MNIGIFGLGNMGSAIIKGILGKQTLSEKEIMGFDPLADKRDWAEKTFNIVCKSEDKVCDFADLIVLAVKPSDLAPLLTKIKDKIKNQLILSICAGISIKTIETIIGLDKKIARAMPNTPLLVSAGATGIAFNIQVQAEEKKSVQKLLQNVGLVIEIEEKFLDAVTGLSGSGPAFVFMFIEALADGGVKSGLSRETALKLAGQTVFGAAKLFMELGHHPGQLKDMVTSPGGTTIEGISVLERNAFRASVMEAVFQATEKSKKLSSS